MQFKVVNGKALQFYNSSGSLTGTIEISSSGDMIVRPDSGSTKNVIIGNRDTAGDIDVGLATAAITMKFLGGGTITSNGNTLNIGDASNGDKVLLANTTFSSSFDVTGSLNISGSVDVSGSVYADYFIGDGSGLTNLQRPISSSIIAHLTASNSNAGYYFRVGGGVSCSIQSSSLVTVATGTEYEFFQTSSAGNVLFHTGSGTITLNSKNDNLNLAGQFSSAVLKKVGTDEWDLIGDLT